MMRYKLNQIPLKKKYKIYKIYKKILKINKK